MNRRYDLSDDQFQAARGAFRAAIAKADGQTAFANICRCSQANISQLLANDSLLPSRFVPKVEVATGVSRHDLRPDIYPPEPSSSFSRPDGGVAPGAPVVAFDRGALLNAGRRV